MYELHIRRDFREQMPPDSRIFSSGKILFEDLAAARSAVDELMKKSAKNPELSAENLYAMGIIHTAFHTIIRHYFSSEAQKTGRGVYHHIQTKMNSSSLQKILQTCIRYFPSEDLYRRGIDPGTYLNAAGDGDERAEHVLENLFVLHLENMNPAFNPAAAMINNKELRAFRSYTELVEHIRNSLSPQGNSSGSDIDPYSLLLEPARRFPTSLQDQLECIMELWSDVLGDMLPVLLRAVDYLKEVNSFAARAGADFGGGDMSPYEYSDIEDHADFSHDTDWMPRVVLLAKSTLVWLDQLTKKYNRHIHRLDQIPDEELDIMQSQGFTSLWLIGLWERSPASREIKQRCGNSDAVSSAYALYCCEISQSIGGWEALSDLRQRCAARGIRLAADMVPNHTGIDSLWVQEHPDWFLSLPQVPYPSYTFSSENLSSSSNMGVYLEDHYYDQSDAAVVFKRVDFGTGETRYIYHGNDGTSMPWNDTAQLDYLNPDTREAVIQTILHVAGNFPIIRFDAAMTLAKKHIHRLWFPAPGSGGDISSRSEHGLSWEEFNRIMPREFWREVVERIDKEAPETILLAEAFWMMEGYFVRNLGMHRVYNSAFMNMLKNEKNAEYRETIKNTIAYDPEILKRFVNFMNNPDEDTAIAQFGDGDKYFGVCTLMVTMPGLPMFGHGQVEGFTEKYGMEYQRAYFDEDPRMDLIQRHEREIFPLMKKRELFSGVEHFRLYDVLSDTGVLENVFAYSNASAGTGADEGDGADGVGERALVVYNNSFQTAAGYIPQKIAEDFALSAHADTYCLLQESRSGLWYIRSSNDLARQGFFVSLQGYEAQVYLNIHEIHDDQYASWRQLHDELAGIGTYNIHKAAQDIRFRSVITRALADLFSSPLPTAEQRAKQITNPSGDSAQNTAELLRNYQRFLEQLAPYSNNPKFVPQKLQAFEAALNNLRNTAAATAALSVADTAAVAKTGAGAATDTRRQSGSHQLAALIIQNLEEYRDNWSLESYLDAENIFEKR